MDNNTLPHPRQAAGNEERQRLEEALLRANEANAELERFVYAASHDLREPLRVVATFTRLLSREAKGRLGEDADRYIEFILDGTARMRTVIDGLLALSRGVAAESTKQPVNSGKILTDCILALQGEMGASDAVIACGELPEVQADGAQLAELFTNLLSNAIRFRKPDAPLRVEVSAAKVGGMWQFRVRDNGRGFDPAQAQALFTPFRRLHGRDISGAGVGLALCRKIVERHGGRIWAEGALGEGAAFLFTLPGIDGTGILTR